MHARDVHTVLDTLQLEDAVLGGYSFGGVIAAYYVARYHFPHGKQAVTDQRQCTEVYAAG